MTVVDRVAYTNSMQLYSYVQTITRIIVMTNIIKIYYHFTFLVSGVKPEVANTIHLFIITQLY